MWNHGKASQPTSLPWKSSRAPPIEHHYSDNGDDDDDDDDEDDDDDDDNDDDAVIIVVIMMTMIMMVMMMVITMTATRTMGLMLTTMTVMVMVMMIMMMMIMILLLLVMMVTTKLMKMTIVVPFCWAVKGRVFDRRFWVLQVSTCHPLQHRLVLLLLIRLFESPTPLDTLVEVRPYSFIPSARLTKHCATLDCDAPRYGLGAISINLQ